MLEMLLELHEEIGRARDISTTLFDALDKKVVAEIAEQRKRQAATHSTVSGLPCSNNVMEHLRTTSSECYVPPDVVDRIERGGE